MTSKIDVIVPPNHKFQVTVDNDTGKRLKEDEAFRKTFSATLLEMQKLQQKEVITSENQEITQAIEFIEPIENDQHLDDTLELPDKDRFAWTHELIMMLLEERHKNNARFNKPTVQKRKVWEDIAVNISNKAKISNIAGNVCDKKWRSLKQRYKIIKEKCVKTGYSKITWRYFNKIDEIISEKNANNQPSVRVVSRLVHESALNSTQPNTSGNVHTYTATLSPQVNMSNLDTIVSQRMSEMRQKDDENPPKWFKQYIKNQSKEREEDRKLKLEIGEKLEKIEEQKVIQLSRMNDLLERLLNK